MRIISFLLLLFISWASRSQQLLSAKAEKQFNTGIDLFNKGEREKGIANAREVLDQYPQVTELWNILAQMHQKNFEICKDEFNQSMNKSLEDIIKQINAGKKNTKKKKDNKDIMGTLGPYLTARLAYDNFLREATLKSRSTFASIYLRGEKIDNAKPDSLVGNEAREAFYKAEDLFAKGKYEEAIPYYREAITKANGYYFNAELYLGDSYYMLHEFDSAKKYFSICAKTFPQYIEPHKYLADCYAKVYDFENAIESCIETFKLYPDNSMFMKLEDAAKLLRKKYNDGWIIRGCYPYNRNAKEAAVNGPWVDYVEFSKKAWAASDSLGVIQHPSDFENEQFAEVYAWKKMLEKDNGKTPDLAFAQDMQKRGYLDCYVFISLFHYDLYPTYKYYVSKQPEKVGEYLRNVVAYK